MFGGLHLLIVGLFAFGIFQEPNKGGLTFLLWTIDFPVVLLLLPVSASGVFDNHLALYSILLVVGSAFYFVVGWLLGWLLIKLIGWLNPIRVAP